MDMVSTSGINGMSGAYPVPLAGASERRLRPGVHLVLGPRPLWDALLEESREASGQLILLSPDPPTREELRSHTLRRFWFRGIRARGSVSVRAPVLCRMVPRLASPSAVTAVEGLEVLLFWNSLEDVVDFLRILDGQLVRSGSQGLVYVRPGLIDEKEYGTLKSHFPLSIDLRESGAARGLDTVRPATA
ncbi:MAG TPA: hypothetical protein VI893_01365 [Thermoplasmata archaeon]|nr:hypothetical protein [Thermoplasmata archaeon]